MFEKKTYFQAILIILGGGLAYSHIEALRHNSLMSNIVAKQPKTEVVALLGAPIGEYHCKTDANLPEIVGPNGLCKSNVEMVDAFSRCHIQFVCPGWNYVAFDAAGRAMGVFASSTPLFRGGPEF